MSPFVCRLQSADPSRKSKGLFSILTMPEIETLPDGKIVMFERGPNGYVLDETSLVYTPRPDKTQRLYNSQ